MCALERGVGERRGERGEGERREEGWVVDTLFCGLDGETRVAEARGTQS